jgi:ElaA protein
VNEVRWASSAGIAPATLYAVLRLRAEVFVVEQDCPYLDLDGRDLEAGTRHAWVEHDGVVVAYLRLLDEGDGHRIGRVVTSPTHRGRGLAGELMAAALAATSGPVVLDAQSRLVAWYEEFGFRVTGPEYLDDGIAHVPMRLDRTFT